MQTHGRFTIKNIQTNESDQLTSNKNGIEQPELPEQESQPQEMAEGSNGCDGNEGNDENKETVGRFKIKNVNEELEGKVSSSISTGGLEGALEPPQLQHLQQQQSSNESDTTESETKGRFKIKNVKASPDEAVVTSPENKSLGGAIVDMSQSDNQEVKGRFKVKNVKLEELPKESQISTLGEGISSLSLPSDSSERLRSKSSPHLNHVTHTDIPKDPSGSAKKGRFTVTTGGSSTPLSPGKAPTPVQEIGHTHSPSNGPVLFTSKIITPSSAAAGTSNGHGDDGGHSSVGIAMEQVKSTPSNNSAAAPSSVKKPKSRFTVKTISLEDEKETDANINSSNATNHPSTPAPLPPLPPFPSNLPSKSSPAQGTPSYPRSKNGPDVTYLDVSSGENGSQSFPSPNNSGGPLGRFQQLLESNFQILMSLQQEMKAQGISVNLPDSSFRSPSIPPGTVSQKSPNSERLEEHTIAIAPVVESSTLPKSASSSLSTNPPPSSVISASTLDREKDKSFGKMSHFVNELKKELDHACRSRKENLLETQRLRERCVQMEEKLQSEKNKNVLLEEQLEKSLRKQKELQALLDAAVQSSQLQNSQQHQSVAVQVESNQILPPVPSPLGTPTGSRKSLTSSVSCAPAAPAKPPIPSLIGPISTSSSNNIPATKSHSNIPSLGGMSTLPLNLSSSSLVSLSSSSSLQTLDPLSSAVAMPSVSAHNSSRFSGSTDAAVSNPFFDHSYSSLRSTQQGPGNVNGVSSEGGGGNQHPTDLLVVHQSDEFDNFIASRGAPSDEWTASESVDVSVSIFPTSPRLLI